MFQAKCVLSGAQNVHEGPGLLLDLSCLFNMENYLLDNGLGMDRILAGLVGQEVQTMDIG